MLLGIALVLVAASLAGTLLLVSRAPAGSLALVGGVVGGLCGFYYSSRHDPKGVPADVAVWATCGLVALGLIGLLVTPRALPSLSAALRPGFSSSRRWRQRVWQSCLSLHARCT